MKTLRDKYYIHFETKPTFPELDAFFSRCEQYEPVMATSYYVVPKMGNRRESFHYYAMSCFPRYRFVLCKASWLWEHGETGFIKTDLALEAPPSAENP